ncbi:MAG: 50S ribosomal protein L11 methyltransferase [Bacteroidales bacterium]|nr:50S ribosomal protein L11 methyltransferase [Bacteroidales bacterium]
MGLNNSKNIEVYQGDASLLGNKKYDIIFANINRNILLNDLSVYVKCFNENGKIFLSGFYEKDIEVIEKLANELQLKISSIKLKNSWASLCLLNDGIMSPLRKAKKCHKNTKTRKPTKKENQ